MYFTSVSLVLGSNLVKQVIELAKEANRYKLIATSHARTFLGLTAIATRFLLENS
jgi:hypothetical protein